MLEQICAHLHNFFEISSVYGWHTITDGSLAVDGIQGGQYFRIKGSVFNDGLHQYPAYGLMDETFEGTVALCAIPRQLVELAGEIEKWQEENASKLSSPYSSESFGGYSYSKATGSGDNAGGILGWQDIYRSRLNRWRKIP